MKIENYEKCFCLKVRWVQNIIKSKFDDETETMNEIMELRERPQKMPSIKVSYDSNWKIFLKFQINQQRNHLKVNFIPKCWNGQNELLIRSEDTKETLRFSVASKNFRN